MIEYVARFTELARFTNDYVATDAACQAPNPGPTRLADPNRFPGCETQDCDSLPDFFFFLKPNWYQWV